MKRILCLFLAVLFCLTALCGCDLNLKPKTLENTMEIPDDGIIEASVFKSLKNENKVIVFVGESGGIHYEWTVFGSDIDTPKDTNLKLEVSDETESSISFQLCSNENFGFVPVLSIYSSYVWNTDNAVVSGYKDGVPTKLCSASVTGSKNTILNFSVTEIGSFIIEAEKRIDSEDSPMTTEEDKSQSTPGTETADPYTDPFSETVENGGRRISDGKQKGQDQYKTDPVPEGKPLPVEPEDQKVDTKKGYTCTFSIECTSIFNNLDDLESGKLDVLPSNGIIFPKAKVTFYEGESVYDVLQRVCKNNGIQMEASWTPIYNSAYVEGICNLYEFDCGTGSGWMYRVNGWYPNYGCSRYQLEQGDVVEWRYTCDLGADIGGGYAVNP